MFICSDFISEFLNPTDEWLYQHMYSVNVYHITYNCETLIDNIFTNNLENIILSGLIINDITDHLPVFSYDENYETCIRWILVCLTVYYTGIRTEQAMDGLTNDLLEEDWDLIYYEKDGN